MERMHVNILTIYLPLLAIQTESWHSKLGTRRHTASGKKTKLREGLEP